MPLPTGEGVGRGCSPACLSPSLMRHALQQLCGLTLCLCRLQRLSATSFVMLLNAHEAQHFFTSMPNLFTAWRISNIFFLFFDIIPVFF